MRWLPLAGLIPVAIAPAQANDYFTTEEAQRALFPSATQFIDSAIELSDAQIDRIKQLSGVRQRWDNQAIWKAMKDDHLLGWFMVDRVVGKHEFITYAVALSSEGRVLGIEIMQYLETYGDDVRQADWRQQFFGKSLKSPLDLGDDIRNIGGATLSCRNITNGVKRLLALQRVALPATNIESQQRSGSTTNAATHKSAN